MLFYHNDKKLTYTSTTFAILAISAIQYSLAEGEYHLIQNTNLLLTEYIHSHSYNHMNQESFWVYLGRARGWGGLTTKPKHKRRPRT